MTGQKFGKLTAIKYIGIVKKARSWLCKCECGNEKIVRSSSLLSGHTLSCGCYQKEKTKKTRTTIGMSQTKIYKVWAGIKQRCINPDDKYYKNYGGRGINICDKWLDFEGFYEDMYPTYKEGLSIDRADNNKGYFKDNCRWVDRKTQQNNRRVTKKYLVNGEYLTRTEIARKSNLSFGAVKHRVEKLNWSIEKTMNTPSRKGSK